MQSAEFPLDPNRYNKIDELNHRSWYMHDAPRSFDVIQSVHSAGEPRVAPDEDSFEAKLAKASRVILGGNMSTIRHPDGKVPYGPREMTDDERYQDALDNMTKHFASIGIDMADVKLLNPERDYSTPLTVVNADADTTEFDGTSPIRLQKSGDFVYTRNPDTVLGVRPADCPIAIMSAETPDGPIGIMIHFAWRGPASGQFADMQRELAALGVDPATMKVYITPGGQAETYQFKGYKVSDNNPTPEPGHLFTNLEDSRVNEDDEIIDYSFGIDTPNAVYEEFIQFGLDSSQLFLDTSDTTALETGYASNRRAGKLKDDNTRDLVTVKFHDLPPLVASNPEKPTPPEIQKQIVPIDVAYVDFNNEVKYGIIEVNKAVAADVQAFFNEAIRLNFPIESVVKSSNSKYAWDDDKLMDANTSSGFNYRLIKGTDKPSLHGLGRAFDVNTRLNPFIRYDTQSGEPETDPVGAVYEPGKEGVLTADHPLVLFMKEKGWTWGGDWQRDDRPGHSSRTDYQHFEKKS
jgi:copper oxidase (laccase) domain-containing protein